MEGVMVVVVFSVMFIGWVVVPTIIRRRKERNGKV